MTVEPIEPYLQPLRKSVVVDCGVERAFALFTDGVARWWPLATHSISGPRAVAAVIEGREGGEVYEVRDDRERCPWGKVVAWQPPSRLVLSWHPGRAPGTAQEIELRFTPEGTRTRVDLEHRGWATLGKAAAETRQGYDGGWRTVLAAYVTACTS